MLFQSDLNKCRILKLAKLDNLIINSASNKLLQGSKKYFIEYINQIFPNNSHINLRACDASSPYYCPLQLLDQTFQKWDYSEFLFRFSNGECYIIRIIRTT